MTADASRYLLSIMTWIFVCVAFEGIVRADQDGNAGVRLLFPVWYQLLIIFVWPLAAMSTLWLRLMGYFKIMSFARYALFGIYLLDWLYMAFLLPVIVLNQLKSSPGFGSALMEHMVDYKDLMVLISFNVISITIIMIFSEVSRTYRKAHDL